MSSFILDDLCELVSLGVDRVESKKNSRESVSSVLFHDLILLLEQLELGLLDPVVGNFRSDNIFVRVKGRLEFFLDMPIYDLDVALEVVQIALHIEVFLDEAMCSSNFYKWKLRPVVIQKDGFKVLKLDVFLDVGLKVHSDR